MKYLLLILALSFSQVWAASVEMDELWLRLRDDFESKPYFFNAALNDFRDNVKSPFAQFNNARPLTPNQISQLPEGEFLSKRPFALAMAGRERLIKAGKIKASKILAVVDFSLPSSHRRLFILDLENEEVLMNTYTSHADASDPDHDGIPEIFSNVSGSLKSSVGFMSTESTYTGTFGYSLRIRGYDPKLNSNVLARAIVMHGFSGLDPVRAIWGNVSTSEGCFMISNMESGRFWNMEDKPMSDLAIEMLKPGALLFSYTDQELMFNSAWIKKSDMPEARVEIPSEFSL